MEIREHRSTINFPKTSSPKASNFDYHKIVTNLEHGVIIYAQDPNDNEVFTIVEVNPAAEAYLGIKKADALNKTINEFFPNLEKLGFTQLLRSVLNAQKIEDISNFLYQDENISQSAWAFKAIPISEIHVAVVFENTTDLSKMEHAIDYLNSTIDSLAYAIITTDNEFNIQSWSRGAEKIYGWTAEEVIGRSTAEVLKNRYYNDTNGEEVLKEFQENGIWRGEVIQKNKDGKDIYIMARVSALRDYRGEVIGAVAANLNITKEKQFQQQLINSYQYLGFINRQVNILLELHRQNHTKTGQEVCEFLMQSALKMAEANIGCLFKFHSANNQLELVHSCGLTNDEELELLTLKDSHPHLYGQLSKLKNKVLARTNEYNLKSLSFVNSGKVKQFLLLPMIICNQVKGAMLICFSEIRDFDSQQMDFFEVFSYQTACILNSTIAFSD